MTNETRLQRSLIAVSSLPLLAGIAIAIWLLAGGGGPIGPSFELSQSETKTIARIAAAQSRVPTTTIRNIEDVRVGDRVLADNPELSDADRNVPDPDPETWRKLELAMRRENGYRLDITLIRSLDWIEDRRAVPGAKVALDIPEMEAYGYATVSTIAPCPPIKPGPGSVVIGTYRHTSGDTLNIGVSGLDEPIGATADHPFWSHDRQQFIETGKLQIGEKVVSYDQKTYEITSITRRGPPEPVYNLEVHAESVYYVSELGILVHNYGDDTPVSGPVAYGTPYRQLSAKRIAVLEAKVANRTITKDEWKHLQWQKRLSDRRQSAIDEFWIQEQQRLAQGLPGTRNWNDTAKESILAGIQPRGIFSHHTYSVSQYPQLANDPSNILPVTFFEHLQKWHGGNWRNPTHGVPLRPDLPDSF
jgi:hypothetical protein